MEMPDINLKAKINVDPDRVHPSIAEALEDLGQEVLSLSEELSEEEEHDAPDDEADLDTIPVYRSPFPTGIAARKAIEILEQNDDLSFFLLGVNGTYLLVTPEVTSGAIEMALRHSVTPLKAQQMIDSD